MASLSLLLTGCGSDLSEGGYSPIWSPDGTKIAYVYSKYEHILKTDIRVMDSSGKNKRILTDSVSGRFNWEPTWSPDSKRIAFVAEGEDNSGIWVVDADGNNRVNLINSPASTSFPAWSPDGKTIAFVSFQIPPSPPELMAMDFDGSNARRLEGPNPVVPGTSPPFIWSPDGSKLLFVNESLEQNRAFELWVMNADSHNMTMLLSNAYFPVWSPDGSKIAYVSDIAGKPDVWVTNGDGSNPTRLTTNGNSRYPVWSADGTEIYFLVGTSGIAGDIWVMNKDGSDAKSLNNQEKVAAPVWSPDRNQIAFVSTSREPGLFHHGQINIWVMNVDGTGLRKVTE
jgi:TolB protein